jgi:4-hydroxyphenylacetate 3-hydroxylase N terminal
MTCLDPDSGQRISVSWLFPRSAEDLKKKRRNSELWNELSWGQLGRSPDILAPYIISALHLKDEFSAVKHPKCDFGENLENYYRYCKIHDLFLTHAFGDPQVDRSQQPQNEQRMAGEDDEVALHVVEETKDGVIVSGGKQLSTAAPHSHEVYISLSATFARRSNPKCVLAFAIPTASPGLKILAREPVSRWFGTWGHPLQMLDEQDCMLFFDRVLVPWDRLFMLYDPTPMVKMLGAAGGSVNFNFLGWANLCQVETRMRLMTAVATMVAEAIGVIEFREVARQAGRDGDLLRDVAACHGGHRAPGPADANGAVDIGAGVRHPHLVRPNNRPDDRTLTRDLCLGRASSCSRAKTISQARRSAPISTATCGARTPMSNTSRGCSAWRTTSPPRHLRCARTFTSTGMATTRTATAST